MCWEEFIHVIKHLYILFAFLGLDLPQVELELLALQDVTISPAALAGPGSDASCRKEEEQ